MQSVFKCNKRDKLYMHTLEHKYDIVGLSEIRANDNISDSELNIPGCNLYTKDRNNKFKSKEVSLYINDYLVSSHYEVLSNTEFEAVWAKISSKKIPFTYGIVAQATEDSMQLAKR